MSNEIATMAPMYSIFFSNAAITDTTTACQCQSSDYFDALAVFDALCNKFLVVELYGADGQKLLAYDNI